jgi:hypothetical protein
VSGEVRGSHRRDRKQGRLSTGFNRALNPTGFSTGLKDVGDRAADPGAKLVRHYLAIAVIHGLHVLGEELLRAIAIWVFAG